MITKRILSPNENEGGYGFIVRKAFVDFSA
jgi:hypothetical protein